MNHGDFLLSQLATRNACLVTVASTRGSVPRATGTWMAVFADGVIGTIGGGQLEFQAIAEAQRRLRLAGLAGGDPPITPNPVRYALGPNLGQCCGGEMVLSYQAISAADVAALGVRLKPTLQPLALFGGGHVGRALVNVLGTLPFEVTWIDSRDEIFPATVPDNVQCEHSDPVHAAVPLLESGSAILIMSFSHAEDLDVVAACLVRQRQRADLPFVGLIGSQTKWATFSHRLAARGFTPAELAHVTCPIGISGIASKLPEAIAVSVAAQLLQAGWLAGGSGSAV